MNELHLHINDVLERYGFKKTDSKEFTGSYNLNLQKQMQGASMIINGKPINQPGKIINYNFTVEYVGDLGEININDNTISRPMSMIHMIIHNDAQGTLVDDSTVIYDEDLEYFDQLFTNLYNQLK